MVFENRRHHGFSASFVGVLFTAADQTLRYSRSRYASVQGWPQTIYSDQGSQVVEAEQEIKQAWEGIDKKVLQQDGIKKGTMWVFGPADSPWYQGAVESLVKSMKRAIHFSVHNQRQSVPEF